MKRLRVKTGIVVPSRAVTAKWREYNAYPSAGLPSIPFGISPEGVKLVSPMNTDGTYAIPASAALDGPVCTSRPPCSHCWYCQKAAGR